MVSNKNMINFCVSLTSLPSRIDNIYETLNSIKNQTLKPNKVFLNLPYNPLYPNHLSLLKTFLVDH